MEKSQYELCLEILRRLEKAGALRDMILIGSWCMPFYQEYFQNVSYAPSLKTRDIDFLIPKPKNMRSKVDIADLMKDLGFIRGFRGREGYVVLEHPELTIEFLVPEKGKGSDKPVPLPALGLNAQGLRFLDMLSHDTLRVKIEDVSVVMPHPVNFALHKLIISKRRRDKEKSEKDSVAAIQILKSLIDNRQKNLVRDVFDALPKKWKKAISKELLDNHILD